MGDDHGDADARGADPYRACVEDCPEAKRIKAEIAAFAALRDAAVARAQPLLDRAPSQATREQMHAALDALLDLREVAMNAPDEGLAHEVEVGGAAMRDALPVAQALLEAAAWWTVPIPPFALDRCGQRDAPAEARRRWWRVDAREMLLTASSLMPNDLKRELAAALAALDDGSATVPDLLLPSPKAAGRPGRNPALAWACEADLLLWVARRTGRGCTEARARGDVAAAIGTVEADAVRKWKGPWRRRVGAARADLLLGRAVEAGQRDLADPTNAWRPVWVDGDAIMGSNHEAMVYVARRWRDATGKA